MAEKYVGTADVFLSFMPTLRKKDGAKCQPPVSATAYAPLLLLVMLISQFE